MPRKLTLVAVGDVTSEKTTLLMEYTSSTPRREYLPVTFVANFQEIVVDSAQYSVYFMDTDPGAKYETLRKDIYTQADCLLLCYSIKDRRSFENIKEKWVIDVRTEAPHTPIILVGTGVEARREDSFAGVTSEEGTNLKRLVGAAAFAECSVARRVGIDEVFVEAVRSTYPKGCCRRKARKLFGI